MIPKISALATQSYIMLRLEFPSTIIWEGFAPTIPAMSSFASGIPSNTP